MNCGDTLLIPAPGTCEETPHPRIVVTEPDPLCVIVCLSTLRYNKDQTVVLRRGEHAFYRARHRRALRICEDRRFESP